MPCMKRLMFFSHKAAGLALILLIVSTNAQTQAGRCGQIRAQPDQWLQQTVNQLIGAARAAYESERAQPRYERFLDSIVVTLSRCQLARDTNFVAQHARFLDYVSTLALDRLPDHELGFVVSDEVYFSETRQYVAIPDFLLKPEFLRVVGRSETLDRAKAMLQELNRNRSVEEQLVFFSYESRHLGTPDNPESFRRFLIVVPGNAARNIPEKWVQFGVTDPGQRPLVRNVSVVAVVGDSGNRSVYFKDYFRTYRRNGSITIKGRWELGEGDDNCTLCHKSGVLPIFPVSGSVNGAELPIVNQVNERFLSYGRAQFGKYLDLSKFGPGLGSNLPGTQNCSSCHQAKGLGALNWPMDRTLISSYVKGGKMPFGAELTREERTRLYRKLVQDYFSIDEARPGILKSWLLEKPTASMTIGN
jgi:hypothetical protein